MQYMRDSSAKSAGSFDVATKERLPLPDSLRSAPSPRAPTLALPDDDDRWAGGMACGDDAYEEEDRCASDADTDVGDAAAARDFDRVYPEDLPRNHAESSRAGRSKYVQRRYRLPVPFGKAAEYFRPRLAQVIAPSAERRGPAGFREQDIALHWVDPVEVAKHVGAPRFDAVRVDVLDPALDASGLPTRLDFLRVQSAAHESCTAAANAHINDRTSRLLQEDSMVANYPPSHIEQLQATFMCAHLRDTLPRTYRAPCPVFNCALPCRVPRSGKSNISQIGAGLTNCPCTLVEMFPGHATQKSKLITDSSLADDFDAHVRCDGRRLTLMSCVHRPWHCLQGDHVCLYCLLYGPPDISVEQLTSHGFATCPRRINMALLHLHAPPWYGHATGIPTDLSIPRDIAEAHLRHFAASGTVQRVFALMPKYPPDDYPLMVLGSDTTLQYVHTHSVLATTRHLGAPPAAPRCAWPLPAAQAAPKRPRSASAEHVLPQENDSLAIDGTVDFSDLYLVLWKQTESVLEDSITYFKRRIKASIDSPDPDVDARTLLVTFMGIQHQLNMALAQHGV
jgi:hypothetical protein